MSSLSVFSQTMIELQGATTMSNSLPTSNSALLWATIKQTHKTPYHRHGLSILYMSKFEDGNDPEFKSLTTSTFTSKILVGRYYYSLPGKSIYSEHGWYAGLQAYPSSTDMKLSPRIAGYWSGYYSATGNMFPRKDWYILAEYGLFKKYWYIAEFIFKPTERFGYGFYSQAFQVTGLRVQSHITKHFLVSVNGGWNFTAHQKGFFVGLKYNSTPQF